MRNPAALPLMRFVLICLWLAGCGASSTEDYSGSSVVVTPSALPADGKTAGTINVLLVGKNSQPVAGAHVKIQTTGGKTTTIIQPNPTGSDGRTSGTITSTAPGAQTLSVSISVGGVTTNLPQTASVTFGETDAQRAALYLAFTPDTQSYVADGQTLQTITLMAHDGAGVAAVGQPVSWSVSGSQNTLHVLSATTDSLGMASATLSSTRAEPKTITVQSGLAQASLQTTFIPGPASFAHSSLSISPNSLAADGTTTSTVLVSLNDAFDNPIPATSTSLGITGVSGTTLTPLLGPTDTQGHFTARLTGLNQGSANIVARLAGLVFSQSVVLTAPGPSALRSSVVASPFNVQADGVDVASVVVQVNDAFGRPLPFWPVTLSVTGAHNTLNINTGMTDFSGALRASLQSSASGTKTITANLGTTAVMGSVIFLPGAPVFANSSFAADTTVLLADGNQTATFTLTARDAQYNPVLGAPVNFVATGTHNTLTPTSALTDVAGQAKVKLATTAAESKVVTALLTSTSLSAQVAFVPRGSSLLTSSFVANPNTLAADGLSTANLLLTLEDANGNPISGDTVVVASSGTSNTLSPVQGYTDASGVFTSSLASSHAEVKTVTASVYGQSLTTQVRFVATAVDHTHSSINATPSSVVADGNSQIAITFVAEDSTGNPIANQPLSLSLSGTHNVVVPLSGSTDATGTFVASAKSTTAEAKTATITIAGSTFTKVLQFVPGAPSPTRSSVVLNPNTQVADNISASTVTVLVRDAQANPIANTTVSLTASGGQTTLTPSSGATNALGQWSAQVTSKLAQTETLSASFAGVTAQQNITFVAGPPNYAHSTFAASPATLIANNVATTTLTLNLVDAQNNPVANQNVVLTSTGSNNTSFAAAPSTNAQGMWSAALRSGTAESKTVTAQVGALNFTTQVNFLPAQPANANSSFVASPNSTLANGSSPITLTVVLADALGNPSTNQSVTLSGTGSLNNFGHPSGTTDATGTFSTTLTSTQAQHEIITAQAGTLSLPVNVSFSAGQAVASASTLTASPNQVVADGTQTTTVVLQAYDAQSNQANNQTVSLTTSGTDSIITPSSVVTDANGRASFTWAATVAGVKTGTVNLNGTGLGVQVIFVPGPADTAHSSISVQPASLTADGNQTASLTVVARDSHNNAIGQSFVNLSSSGPANTFAQAYGNTDASGTFDASVSSAQAQNDIITAQIGTPVTASVSTAVRFAPGSVSAQASSLVASPNQLVADGNQAAQIALVVRDATGNALGNQAVTFQGSGAGATLSATTGTTDASGQLVVTYTSVLAEQKTVTATFGGTQLSVPVTFVAGPVASSTSTLSSDAQGLTADGASAAHLTLSARDINNNVVSNQNVTFAASGTGNGLTPNAGSTDSTGRLVTSLTSTSAATKTVTATLASGVQVSTTVSFVAGTGSQLNVVTNPNQVVADGVTAMTSTVTVTDSSNNLVAGAAVSFAVDGNNTQLSAPNATTDASGQAQTTLTSTLAQSEHLTVSVGAASRTQSIVFLAGSPNQQQSSMAANGNSVIADGNSTTQLLVVLRDAFGNPSANQNVTFSSTGTSNTFAQVLVSTNAQGVAQTTLRSVKAEMKTVSAQAAGGVNLSVPVSFVAASAVSAQSTLSLSPNVVTADGVQTTTATLVAKDSQGNIAANQSVSFAVNDAANVLGTPSGVTDATGTLTTTLSSTHAATKTLTASVGQAGLSAQVVFVAGSPNSTQSTLSSSQTSVAADGSATANLSAAVADAFGNPVANQNVTFASSGASNTFAPTLSVTDSAGHASATLSSPRAETKIIVATFGPANANTTVTFTPGAASAATSQLAASPNTLVADGSTTSSLMLVAQDAQGNLLANQNVTVSSTGTANTLNPSAGVTDANAMFVSTLASTKAEFKTITATFGGVSLNQQVTFVPGPISQPNSTFTINPNAVVADNASTTSLSLTLRDARNNPIANQAVSLAASGSANTFSSSNLTSNAAGSITATLRSSVAETKTVTASIGAVVFSATVSFTPGAASSAQSSVTPTPPTLTADGVASSSLVVLVRDAQNNPVPNQSVTLSSTGSSNTLTPPSLTTDANGRATATLASRVAEAKTVTATFSGGSTQTSVTFVPGPAAMGNTLLVANPNTVVADGTTTTALSLTLRDAQNNPIANQNVTWSSTGINNVITFAQATTDSTGVATATLASSMAQSKTITAQAGGISPQVTVVFVPGSVTNTTSSFVASPNTQLADNANTIALVATAKDAQGNPIANLSVVFAATGSNNTLANATVSTNSSGVAQTTVRSGRAEGKNVQATFGSGGGAPSQTLPVTFVPGSISQSTSSLVGNTNSLVADGNSNVLLSFTALDAQGNPLANQNVTLGATGTSNVLMPNAGTTNGSGVFVSSMTSTKAEAKTIVATAGSITETFVVTFVAGTPAVAMTSLTASPNSVVADNSTTSSLQLTVRDAQGNPVGNQNVTFSSTGTGNTFSTLTGLTASNGTSTTTLRASVAETKTISATLAQLTATTQVTFTAGAAVSANSSLVASPNSVVINGTAASQLTATIRDAQNNPISGQLVSFSSTGSNNTFNPNTATTNSAGQAQTQWTSTTAESKTATAAAGAASNSATVVFVAGSPNQTLSSFVASPNSINADNTTTSTLTVTVKDNWGNLATGQNVKLSGSGSGNTFAQSSGNTTGGVYTTTLRSAVAQNETLTASVAGNSVILTQPMTLLAGSPNATQSTWSASPNTLVANGTATTTITATIRDALGNLISNQNVTFSSTGSANTLSSVGGQTNASGVISTDLSSTKAQTKTVTAQLSNFALSGNVTFVAGAMNAAQSSWSLSPNHTVASSAYNLRGTLVAKDAYNNALSGQSVSFSAQGNNTTFAPSSATLDGNGLAQTRASATSAQTENLVASVGGTSMYASATYTTKCGPPRLPNYASFSTDSAPWGMISADLNKDGALDLAVVNASSNTVNIFLGNNQGTMTRASSFATGASPLRLVNADFDKDGNQDLAVLNKNDGTVGLYLGNGTGSFTSNQTLSVGSAPWMLIASDLDGDGYVDIIVPNSGSNSITILYNSAGLAFSTATVGCGVQPRAVAIADFDGNGALDMVTGNYTGTPISLIMGQGSRSFAAATGMSSNANVTGIVAVDLNKDGKMDFATAHDYSDAISFYAGNGAGGFASGQYRYVAQGPSTITATDINADGYPDLIVPAQYSGGLSITLGTSGGIGATTSYYNFSAPYSAPAGDFDGDGLIDVAVANSGSNAISLLRNIGSGALATAKVIASSQAGPYGIVTTDVNHDNNTDIVTLFGYSGTLSVVSGDGTGNFGSEIISTTQGGSFSFAVRDFNADGNVDIAVSGNTNNVVAVHMGNGSGSFSAGVTYPVGSGPRDIVSADFNGDGVADLAVCGSNTGSVYVLLNQGAGTFAGNGNFSTGATPLGLTTCDLNNDGAMDLIATNSGTTTISYLKGLGNGSFAAAVNYSVQSAPSFVVTGDINNDGYLDVVVSNVSSKSFSVLLGSATGALSTAVHTALPQAPLQLLLADIDNDGVLDVLVGCNASLGNSGLALGNGDGTFGALSMYYSGVYSRALAAADFDGNGQIDFVVANDQANKLTVMMNTTCH